jgi:hypothetical protein
VLSIPASHSAYFSQPDELTRNILIAGGDMETAQTVQQAGGTAIDVPVLIPSKEVSVLA